MYFNTQLKAMAFTFVFSMAQTVEAAPLTSGNTIAATGTTVLAQPELAGAAILNDNLINFSLTDASGTTFFSGDIQNRVIESNTTGALVFAPRMRNVAGTGFNVNYVVNGYAGFLVDATYRTDGLGNVEPSTFSRSADGDSLTTTFGAPFSAGNSSYFSSIATDATAFDDIGTMTIFASIDGTDNPASIFSVTLSNIAIPVAPSSVPVPAAAWLFGSAILGFLGKKRKQLS